MNNWNNDDYALLRAAWNQLETVVVIAGIATQSLIVAGLLRLRPSWPVIHRVRAAIEVVLVSRH